MLAALPQNPVRRGIGAFHLIENDTFVKKWVVEVFQFKMPALLLQDKWGEARIEDSVEVDIYQVVEILEVLARHWITGLVRVSEGIEKGLKGTFHQLHKWLLNGVFARAAKD